MPVTPLIVVVAPLVATFEPDRHPVVPVELVFQQKLTPPYPLWSSLNVAVTVYDFAQLAPADGLNPSNLGGVTSM